MALAMMILAACASEMSNGSGSGDWQPQKPVTLIVPSNPGGGWDQTARFIQKEILAEDLLPVPMEVINRGGAGGTIGLSELIERYKGNPHKLMVTGFGMVGSALMHDSEYSLLSVTPIARLTGEYQVIAVSTESPYQTLEDLLAAFKADPESISWAGGSAGGSDQIFIVQVAEALGIPSEKVNYVAFTGGGEANAALMGNQVTAGITGYGEISSIVEAGRINLLAVSSEVRIVNPDLPTFIEKGVNVTFQNWRGIVAAPGITPSEKAYLVDLVTKAQASAGWQQTLERNQWQDSFMVDPEFQTFLAENKEKTAKTLASMGIGKSSEISAIGPEFFPRAVGIGLVVSALFFLVPAFQQRRAKPTAANDTVIEVNDPNWPQFLLTAALFLGYIFALRFVGFIFATPIFIVAISYIIGSRNWVRDIIVALVLTGVIYWGFENILNVNVP